MPNKYINKLEGQRVLVLGGTSGIGFCVAENALENGAIVIVASSQQSSIDKTFSRLHASYSNLTEGQISGHTIDLRSNDVETSIIELLKFATNDGKDLLDHIVNTAGDSVPIGPLSDFKGVEDMTAVLRTRVTIAVLLAKHAPGNYLRVSNKSSLTFTGGVNTYRPAKGWVFPALSGGAGDGAMRGLAVDIKPIRVNVVAPGAIDTELFSRSFTPKQLVGVKQSFKNGTLVGEMGKPEDMSEAYIYIMKDYFIDGVTILSDGGMLLTPAVAM